MNSIQAHDKTILSSGGIAAILGPDSSPIITSRAAIHAELVVERYVMLKAAASSVK